MRTTVQFIASALFTIILFISTTSIIQAADFSMLSEKTEIHLVTVGPGPLVWERFGHNGIWINDPESGFDRIYHWGLFDFGSENFWPKFLQGYMDYSIGHIDASDFFEFYMQSDRSIWLQTLNLNADQKNELAILLMENDSKGNRIYRYNYYLDNCSTRVRNMLDKVLGGLIEQTTGETGSGKSFRSNTRRLLQMMPGPYMGIQLGLGQPADDEISIWRDMFTPMALRRHLKTIKLRDGAPLILSDKLLYNSPRTKEPETIKSYFGFLLPVSASLGILFAVLGYLAAVNKKSARFFLALLGSIWTLLSGLLGALMLLLWVATEHRYGHFNENLLHFNPLSLILALCFLVMLIRGRLPKMGVKILYAVTGFSLLGFAIQIIPAFDQVNAEIIAIALPAHLGLFWAIRISDRFNAQR